MKVSQIAKKVGVNYQEVLIEVNKEFGSDLKHFSAGLTKDQQLFVLAFFEHTSMEDYHDKVDESLDWDSMPWDKSDRAKTKGHAEWVKANPRAWEAFLIYERLEIKKENQRYITKMRGF